MEIFKSDDTDQVKLEDYVGEGKQFPTVEKLLQSKLDSNKFVEQLQREKREEAERIRREVMVEAANARLNTQNANGSDGTQTGTGTSQNQDEHQTAPLTFEDIDRFLEQKNAKQRHAENLNKVAESVLKATGSEDKARTFLATKAKEMSIPLEKLQELAQESPSALLKLVGINEVTTSPSILPSDKRTAVPAQRSSNPNSPQTLADFSELRRTNFNKWSAPEVQKQIRELRRAEILNR